MKTSQRAPENKTMFISLTRMAVVSCALASIVACSSAEDGPQPEPSAPPAANVDTTIDPSTQHMKSKCPPNAPTPGDKCRIPGTPCTYLGICSQNMMLGAATILCATSGSGGATWGPYVCAGPG
jgi:hypothetical protein